MHNIHGDGPTTFNELFRPRLNSGQMSTAFDILPDSLLDGLQRTTNGACTENIAKTELYSNLLLNFTNLLLYLQYELIHCRTSGRRRHLVVSSVYYRAGDILRLRVVLVLLYDSRRRSHADPEGVQKLPDIRDNCRGRIDHILHRLPLLVG